MDAPKSRRIRCIIILSAVLPTWGCALLPDRTASSGDRKVLWSGEKTLADLEAQAAKPAAAAEDPTYTDIETWAQAISPETQVAGAESQPARPVWPPSPASPAGAAPTGYPILAADTAPAPLPNRPTNESPPLPVFTPESQAPSALAPTSREPETTASVSAPPRDAQPPILGTIQISEAVNVPRSVGDSPAANVRDAGALAGQVRNLLEDYLNAPGDQSLRLEVDRRLLALLSGHAQTAREPLEGATPEQQAIVTSLIEVISTMRAADGGDPLAESKTLLGRLDGLRGALAAGTDLSIPTLEICRSVSGFGQFEPFPDRSFVAGRPVEFVAYCEVSNFASRQGNGEYRCEFALKLAVMDRMGQTVHEVELPAINDRCRSRRTDCFISPLVRIPGTLNPGQYFVKLTVIDKIGGKVAETRTTIQLRPGS